MPTAYLRLLCALRIFVCMRCIFWVVFVLWVFFGILSSVFSCFCSRGIGIVVPLLFTSIIVFSFSYLNDSVRFRYWITCSRFHGFVMIGILTKGGDSHEWSFWRYTKWKRIKDHIRKVELVDFRLVYLRPIDLFHLWVIMELRYRLYKWELAFSILALITGIISGNDVVSGVLLKSFVTSLMPFPVWPVLMNEVFPHSIIFKWFGGWLYEK